MSDGRRFLANHSDAATLRTMADSAVELVGKKGLVRQDPEKKGRGLWTFEQGARI